ncbi:MAG: glycosyltransferase family 2 protein [Candidatus Hydrogenedentes bacterium]|nr:glycosyltransferase family 2 protein [Candidatus Hydrogenedentota bacterium]
MSAITVLTLIPNAGDRLERCLRSVEWADDVFCIVDPNTSDGSDEVARRYSDHVVVHEYRNKADQCNWALPQIDTEWTLVLDADEWVSEGLARRIQEIIATPGGPDGYRIKRLSYFFGRLIRHCGWDRDYNVRLFRTQKGRYRVQRVHATIDVDGPMGRIDEVMCHDDKRNFEEYFRTFQRFTTWSAQDLYDRGKRAGLAALVFRPPLRFFKMYVLRQGFRDGLHGAVLCGLAAFSVFTKYAKLWNIDRLARGGVEGVPED